MRGGCFLSFLVKCRESRPHSASIRNLALLIPPTLALLACERQIRCVPTPNALMSGKTIPLTVQVMTFFDERDRIERERTARREAGFKDLTDYTYDFHFPGNEAAAITKMVAEHLHLAGVFARIWKAPGEASSIADEEWISLPLRGVDAVMTGEVLNFYAYCDENPVRRTAYGIGIHLAYYAATWNLRQKEIERSVFTGNMAFQTRDLLAIAPALLLGYWLDSLHSRNMAFKTRLKARLIRTGTRQVLWEDTLEFSGRWNRSKKGLFEDKFKLALDSLRETNNRMVESLRRLDIRDAPENENSGVPPLERL